MPAKTDVRDFVALVDDALGGEMSEAVSLRGYLHRSPELAWHEHETSALITQALEGFSLKPVADTGLLVRVGGADMPSIGVRAELDGLPVVELSGAPFASNNGAMHACGHDVHMAALVALLRAFATVNSASSAPFALLGVFQPSEEAFPSGAKRILESGVLDAHTLEAMLAVHLHPQVPWGAITTGTGAVNACADSFTLTITGIGGHGAYPHRGHDPVLALSQVVVALQQIVSRRIDPLHPTVVTVGRLEAGSASNVIPDEAKAEGTIRVLDPSDREGVSDLVESIAANTAAAFGCTSRVEIQRGDPVLVNDESLVTAVDPWLANAGFVVAQPMRSCGADDFAFFGDRWPSLMMFLGVEGRNQFELPSARGKAKGNNGSASSNKPGPGLHSPLFYAPDAAIERVARAMLAAFAGAAELLGNRQPEKSSGDRKAPHA